MVTGRKEQAHYRARTYTFARHETFHLRDGWLFNEFAQRECTEEQLVHGVQHFLEVHEAPGFAVSSLHKDARCFLRTYVPLHSQGRPHPSEDTLDSPLTWLGLLRESAMPEHYTFQIGPHRNLPMWLFAYTLYRFKEQTKPEEIVFSLEDLQWAPFSPGRLLCLDKRTILMYLEELEYQTSYTHVLHTAGLNIVTLDESIEAFDMLTAYYTGRRE